MTEQSKQVGAVLVTGGTSGIGLAIAMRFAEQGMKVLVLSRRGATDTSQLDHEVRRLGVDPPRVMKADVAQRAQLVAVADELAEAGLELRTVVASAGTNVRQLALEVSDEAIRTMIDVNLYGLFQTFQVFAPLALARPGARFIAISSVNAIHGMRLRAPYSATKAGVSGLVRALAVEWGPMGATVNAIAPGVIQTPLTQAYMDEHPDRARAVIDHTPVGRLGHVDDVVGAAEFLASPASSFLTGQTIVVDGGLSAGSSWW
jgi:NAD(P)-dependent dehydrogenase (short-subunit alcohol dehydrogenase family)